MIALGFAEGGPKAAFVLDVALEQVVHLDLVDHLVQRVQLQRVAAGSLTGSKSVYQYKL